VVEASDINKENKMNKRGLASPTASKDDILSQTRKAFGKRTGGSRSLEQRLNDLNERELNTVLQTAQFVKLSNSFGKNEPYQVTVDYMYPKMNTGIRTLVAEVLEDAEPQNLPDNRQAERDRVQQETLDAYANELPERVVKDTDVKAEQIQTAILKKLKVI
tara:strand:- start:883 stop:1365 length:483 start_codon:yes stop_codon:yes gene_type:complete